MTYINYQSKNNAQSTIFWWIGAWATSVIVKTWEWALFPSTFPALLTLEHYDTIWTNQVVTKREIVKMTNRVWDVCTIVRGFWTCVQDDSANPKVQGNTALSFVDWDVISNYFVVEDVEDIKAAVKDIWQIEIVAAEAIEINRCVCMAGTQAIKSVRSWKWITDIWATWVLWSTTARFIKQVDIGKWKVVVLYKKTADNKIYWKVLLFSDITPKVPQVWAELVIVDEALDATDWFDACAIFEYTTSDKFFVVYKKWLDDKAYWVVCTVSTVTITAWAPTLIYNTNIVQTWTRPTCCVLWWWDDTLCRVAVWLHDSVLDDAIVIPCQPVIADRTLLIETPIAMESITMNASWFVNVVSLSFSLWLMWCFYDNWTSIRYNTVHTNATVIGTPVTIVAWYVTPTSIALSLWVWYWFASCYHARLMVPTSWMINQYEVNTLWDMVTSFYAADKLCSIYTESAILSNINVAVIHWVEDVYLLPTWDIVAISVPTWKLYPLVRKYLYWPAWYINDKLYWRMDTMFNSVNIIWVAITNIISSTNSQDWFLVSYIDSDWKIYYDVFRNNTKNYIWLSQNAVSAWGTLKVATAWSISTLWSTPSWYSVFVWDNWQKMNWSWDRQFWVWIATNTILLI